MQMFFLNGLRRFLKNGHLPVKLHSSAPPPDLECPTLEFNNLTSCKNVKGTKPRSLRDFKLWFSCLAFMPDAYLLNAGLKHSRSNFVFEIRNILFSECSTGVPQKNAQRLIWCKLNATLSTRSTFIFSESSYFILKFGIKQSKISWKFAEQWLTKVRISGPTDDRRPEFFEKCTNLKQPYIALSKFTGAQKFREFERDAIVLFSYQVNKAFCCINCLYEMKTGERYRYHIFSCW